MRQYVIDSLWCLCLGIYIVAGANALPLHGDEPTLIFMGRDFYYHMQGNTASVYFDDWNNLSADEATEQQLRLVNGTLPKYLYGAIAYFSGYTLEDINQQWAWGSGWDWNHENGHVPSEDLLFRSRTASAVLLAISAIALFFLGKTIAGRAVGYFSSVYYVLNPAILLNGRRAMMEGGMLTFTILAILIAVYLLKHRSWWLYILLGLVSGLAVASKHTAIMTIIIIFAVCGLYLLRTWRKDYRDILKLIGAGLLSLVVFFILNPAWWSNPPGAVSSVLDLRQDLLAGQVGFFGGYENPGEQIAGFARQSFIVLPVYAESDFDDFYSEQIDLIQQYDSSLLSGISLGGSTIGAVILFILTIIGCVQLWLSEDLEAVIKWLITGWLISMILLTLVLTPLEWQRYYLPIYPIIGLMTAIGLDSSVKAVVQWQKKTQK